MTRWLARSSLGLIILVLAALPFALDGRGSEVARATHDGNIHQVSIDVGSPGVTQGVTDNGLPAVVDRDGDGINDAEGYDTPDAGDAPGICGNGIDDDLADSDADTTPDAPDGSIDDGCQVPLSALETCIEIIDDGVLNADEDTQVTGQDRASIDITLGDQPGPGGGVPPARQMSAWQYTLQWDVDVLDVDVQNPNFLILAAGGGQPFTLVVPSVPVTASPFVQAVNDAGPKESGGGVLARLSIEGNAAGLATLSFNAGGTLVQDAVNVGIPINTLNTAQVAVSKDVDGDTTIGNIAGESFGCPEPADVELVSVTTTAPAGATAGAAFNVDVDADVRNNGPADPVSGNVAITLNMPADCSAAGGNTRNQNGINLPATVLVPIATETFSVTCTASSFHDFNATATISSPGAIGDNPNNNGPTTSANSTTAVTATADPGVSSVTVTGAATPVAGTPFNVDVSVALTNGGPYTATVDVTITLTPPAGCSTTSTNPQTVTGVAIPLSGANAAAAFSVTCSPSGSYVFDASAALVLPGLHFTDTNLANNTGAGQGTVDVADAADLAVNSVTVTAPPNSSVGGVFDVTAEVEVENIGPQTPVDADVTTGLVLPPDCTVDPSSPDTNPTTDTGVSMDTQTTFIFPYTWTVTCTQPSNHDFTVNSGIALAAGQPNVLDPNAANDTGTGTGTSATATSADLKVASVVLTAPASANPNTAFSVSVDASLHNNGPFGPANTNATIELTVPTGCTATPAGAQTVANISLPVSTATAMPKQTFSVTCTTSGAKAFSAKVTSALNIVHVSDPTAGNATATSQTHTVNVGAAGLPPTGGDSGTLPGSGLALLLLLPVGAVIAGAGLLTLRRNRRSMRL